MKRLGAYLVFIDESGYLMMPHVAKTWGLRGQTPVFRHRARHRQKVSCICAVTVSPKRRRLGLVFRTHLNTAIDQVRVLSFVRQLLRHLPASRPVVIVWDNIMTHKAAALMRYQQRHRRRLHLENLPPYAPELNPVEWVWENGQCHELANHGLDDVLALQRSVRRHGRRAGRSQDKLRSFVRCSHLPLRL